MSETHTLRLGPLAFRTTSDSGPTEALGNAIEVVGAALTSADPTPKPFTLSVPVGSAGDGDYEEGLRLRRQVRSLLNNTQARLQGLAFSWSVDPDFDGWLLVGGGDLEPGETAGITTGEWRLTLRDCYVAGRRRTHRPAIQASVVDRTAATTPRDHLRQLYSTDFATQARTMRLALGVGLADAISYGERIRRPTVVAHRGGPLAVTHDLRHGQLLSFERPSQEPDPSDVAIRDRRGSADEAGWEQVYGPDHPLTPGDVPTLDNGICRTRWLPGARSALALDAWDGEGWEERARLLTHEHASTHVVSWTPERATIAIVGYRVSTRRTLYVTLQRGWSGPMVELYEPRGLELPLWLILSSDETVTFRQPTSAGDHVATGNPLPVGDVVSFTAGNWVELTRGETIDALAVTKSQIKVRHAGEWSTFEDERSEIELRSSDYIGLRLALRQSGPRVGPELGAETLVDARALPTLVART